MTGKGMWLTFLFLTAAILLIVGSVFTFLRDFGSNGVLISAVIFGLILAVLTGYAGYIAYKRDGNVSETTDKSLVFMNAKHVFSHWKWSTILVFFHIVLVIALQLVSLTVDKYKTDSDWTNSGVWVSFSGAVVALVAMLSVAWHQWSADHDEEVETESDEL